jgi:cytochrome c oxidase cbb3-type subunit 3|tara:strand:- start:474 stop:959 length:486 start_codon:yes stop_codon:yes gene_type:complete
MRLCIVILFALLVIGAVGFLSIDHKVQAKLDQQGLTRQQRIDIEKLGELKADAQTILLYMQDTPMMDAMSGLFVSQCASCHGADGAGETGPNLTDDHYILIKNVEGIYKNIKWGSIAKGMPPWEGILSETEMVLLTAYVAKLRGTSTEGKIPEGVIIEPWK